MDQKFCQSCGMPMETNSELYGTNQDGGKNEDYCVYCFKDGAFTSECTMEEMVDFCVGPMVENTPNMTAEAARGMMMQFFPTLKRWKKA